MAGYGALSRHTVARPLLAAQVVSELGDFVGLAALLLLAYSARQSVFDAAAVLAARGLPALLVATVFSGWLDQPPRRTALIWLALGGACAIALPTAVPTAAMAIVAAGLLGALRAAHRSISAAVIAESVPEPMRLSLFGLSAGINQAAQVVGLLAGAAITLGVGVRSSLLIDLVSFVVAAIVLRRLPDTPGRKRPPRPSAGDGLRFIWRTRTLRWLAIMAWASALGGSLPEAMAPHVATAPTWTPIILAASAAGGALFVVIIARGSFLVRVTNQIWVTLGLGLAHCAAAGVLLVSGPAWAMALANAAIGAGLGWMAGAQATFARIAPSARMAQIEGAMVASIILTGGLGALMLGQLAVASEPAYAYLGAGFIVITTSVLTWRGLKEPTEVIRPQGSSGDSQGRL